MSLTRARWERLSARARELGILSAVVVAVGVALIVAGQLGGWGWMRLPGAVLITIGGVVLGVLIGQAPPGRYFLRQLSEWRFVLAAVAAVAIGLPVVAALVGAAVGLTGNILAIVGALIGLALAAAVVFAVVITLRAVGADWDEETREDRA